ncbi:MAG: hypothetical protein WA814_02490 [Candidatus Baltobacteraceae bacterium]
MRSFRRPFFSTRAYGLTLIVCSAVLASCAQTSGVLPLLPAAGTNGTPASSALRPADASIGESPRTSEGLPCTTLLETSAKLARLHARTVGPSHRDATGGSGALSEITRFAGVSSDSAVCMRVPSLGSAVLGIHHWPTPTPRPTPTPTPHPTPTPTPTPDPTPTPTPPPGAYMYQGCGWPAGDYYNQNVANDAVDPYSSTMIANAPGGNFDGDTSSLERINLATNATTQFTVGTEGGGHNPPMSNGAGTKVPWASNFFIEPASDRHSVTLDTQTCMDSEMYSTEFSGPSGPLAAYDGFNMNLTQTLKSQQKLQEDNVTAAGLPMFGAIDWGEDAALLPGPNHVVQMLIDGPTGENGGEDLSQYGYVPPGNRGSDTPDTGCGGQACTHPLHYGDVLRLQPSFICSTSWSQAAQGLCWQLKNYGMIIADAAGENGLRFGLAANGSDPWDPFSSQMGPFLSNLTIANFDVMTEAAILCESGHTYGKDCF